MNKITKSVAANESDVAEPEIPRHREGYHRTPGQKTHADILEDYANFYGFKDVRRLRDHITGATQGYIIGITIENGRYIFHSRPEEMRGPIPDIPTKYVLPRGAKSAAPMVCSGSPVSSIINIIDIRLDKKLPDITLSADCGFSGPMTCHNCHF